MGSKINLKARINRHSRILKDSIGTIHPLRAFYNKCSYNIILITVIFLFPLYPTFSSQFYEIYEDFYRGDIDENSILSSYDFDNPSVIITSDGFLSVNTIEGDAVPSKQTPRNLSSNTQIIQYTVQSGESFVSIAQKFSISVDTILWANNFDDKKVIHPGDTIKILPVTGVIHTVVKWETLSHISRLYDIDMNAIALQNGLDDRYIISVWQELIIPDGKKIIPKAPVLPPPPKPAPAPKAAPVAKTNTNSSTKDYGFSQAARSEYVNTDGAYQLVKRTPTRTFYWGNCTWFVAQYKNVTWWGNAKDWLPNAKKQWVSTGNIPTLGSIIVFHGKGYHPVYGHVGIVVDDLGSELIIKDMNYRRLNEVTTRKIPKNDPAIIGYIYVD